jgi:hypothetical protein
MMKIIFVKTNIVISSLTFKNVKQMKKKLLFMMAVGLFCSASLKAQQMPQFNSDSEKEAWIKQNPQEYEQIKAKPSEAPVHNTNAKEQKKNDPTSVSYKKPEESVSVAAPVSGATTVKANGAPVYVNTGNPDQDAKNYQIAKEAWIKQNPEEYNKAINPSYKTQEEQNRIVEERRKASANSSSAVTKEGKLVSTQKQIISAKELETMPENKRKNILENPQLYSVE